jgi:hypothetical protein
MKYFNVVLLILTVLLFSGCLDEITGKFMKVDVVYVNLSVVNESNKTLIKDIKAKMGELPKINSPGVVSPEKFPGIYVKIKQPYNMSKQDLVKDISVPNGLDYNGTGNYSFTVQLYENAFNKTLPVYIYSEIIDNKSNRLARTIIGVNSTE